MTSRVYRIQKKVWRWREGCYQVLFSRPRGRVHQAFLQSPLQLSFPAPLPLLLALWKLCQPPSIQKFTSVEKARSHLSLLFSARVQTIAVEALTVRDPVTLKKMPRLECLPQPCQSTSPPGPAISAQRVRDLELQPTPQGWHLTPPRGFCNSRRQEFLSVWISWSELACVTIPAVWRCSWFHQLSSTEWERKREPGQEGAEQQIGRWGSTGCLSVKCLSGVGLRGCQT